MGLSDLWEGYDGLGPSDMEEHCPGQRRAMSPCH